MHAQARGKRLLDLAMQTIATQRPHAGLWRKLSRFAHMAVAGPAWCASSWAQRCIAPITGMGCHSGSTLVRLAAPFPLGSLLLPAGTWSQAAQARLCTHGVCSTCTGQISAIHSHAGPLATWQPTELDHSKQQVPFPAEASSQNLLPVAKSERAVSAPHTNATTTALSTPC